MQFSLTDEQQLLRDSAAAFVRDHSSLQRIRALRDSKDADGFSRDLWKRDGRARLARDRRSRRTYGGLGLGLQGAGAGAGGVRQGADAGAAAVDASCSAAARSGAAAARRSASALLPASIGGELLLALAYQERQQPLRPAVASRPAPSAPATAGACSGEKRLRARRPRRRPPDRQRAHRRRRARPRRHHPVPASSATRRASSITRQSTLDGRNAAHRAPRRRDGRRRRACRRRRRRRRAARRRDRPRHRRPLRRDARRHGSGLRDDARLSEDAPAVRRADRLVPGAQAPRRRCIFTEIELARSAVLAAAHGARRGPRRSAARVRLGRQGALLRRLRPRSATRACRCTAASA